MEKPKSIHSDLSKNERDYRYDYNMKLFVKMIYEQFNIKSYKMVEEVFKLNIPVPYKFESRWKVNGVEYYKIYDDFIEFKYHKGLNMYSYSNRFYNLPFFRSKMDIKKYFIESRYEKLKEIFGEELINL